MKIINQKQQQNIGSTETQIILLTNKINNLMMHLKTHNKDHHSKQGLLKIVNDRKKLLKYLKNREYITYQLLITKLKLRK